MSSSGVVTGDALRGLRFCKEFLDAEKMWKTCGREMWAKSGCRRSPVTTEALKARIWTRTSGPHIVFDEDSENRSPGADFGFSEVPNHDFPKIPSRIFPALFPHFPRNSRPHFSRIFPAISARMFPTFFPHLEIPHGCFSRSEPLASQL